MGHLKIIVDHDKIDYSGPFAANDLLRMIMNFLSERGFDLRQDKDIEQTTSHGKCIEWQISPWKRVTDYIRYMFKVRVLGYDIAKTNVEVNGKKSKIETGRVIIVIDAFMEFDYESKWDDKPLFVFIRTMYDYFIYKTYTERFEHRLVHDANHLHDSIEKFLNMYKHYHVISKIGDGH